MADLKVVGGDKPKVYVIAREQRAAHRWALANRPGHYPKFVNAWSGQHVAGGLNLRGETVYVLDPPAAPVREAWLATGANLVYL